MTLNRILLLLLGGLVICDCRGDALTDRLERLKPALTRQFGVPIQSWRFLQPDVPGAEQPNFDDHAWQEVAPGFSWLASDTSAWLRARLTLPATVAGRAVAGLAVRLELGLSNRCELYVDGQLKDLFRGNNGGYTLTEHARAGQSFSVALHALKGVRNGQLRFARLRLQALPEFEQYLDEVTFVGLLAERVPAAQQAAVKQALSASESCIQFTEVTLTNLESVRAQLVQAQAQLKPLAALTKKYDVYYVGHAHIDMNWKWDWAETIDVCQRTWDSAMKLMDQFPEFRFVQSQPAAYVPVQTGFPAEFARMQARAARGQWEPIGGMWNESDTDLPSGEALARSFLLGQRYFQAHFGRLARTGWLPDSFGHTGQLPQIMSLAGERYFYHMRCANHLAFSWWEAPDGSRVLKAATPSYNTRPQLNQLVTPWENEARFGVPQALVLFGVGDHGGGPTREQILRLQAFQRDPIFPRVHFISADAFFEQLAALPAAAALPVVDTELQYTFPGCYTTHADMKKALRHSENALYTAEVLSSLAALAGQPYPLEAFRKAWDPTAFAQFHDTACGTAIRSTYDWTDQQLAPVFRFAQEQTDKSLQFLTANADTRGPGTQAIVVWNSLAFVRDDVVKVPLADAAAYHSVLDSQGRSFPAQVMDGTNLVFVARAVPAFGHAVYFPATNACAADGLVLRESPEACDLETPSLVLQINKRTGALARLYSKPAHWEVFGGAADAGSFELLGDSGHAWTPRYTGQHQRLTTEGAQVSVLDQGPVFARVRLAHACGHSAYTQEVVVYGALPRIDVPTTIDWQEQQQVLKLRFPLNATNLEANVQIPFGSTRRPVNGQECPGQKWMDVSQTVPGQGSEATPPGRRPAPALYGLSVLNDCKYGFDVSDSVFRLTLLRCSDQPDPRSDQGLQQFTYSLYPHAGDWRAARTEEQALALNLPLLAQVTTPHPPAAGGLPAVSVVNLTGHGALTVSALKQSEDGRGFILRFYEAQGQDTRARIDFGRPLRVEETDLLEQPLAKHPLTVQGSSVTLPVGHNQIISLRLLAAADRAAAPKRRDANGVVHTSPGQRPGNPAPRM